MKQHVYTLDTNEEIIDLYQNVQVMWKLLLRHVEACDHKLEHYIRCYELTFEAKKEDIVLNSYLPYIMERAEKMIEECKMRRSFQVNHEGVSEYPFEFDHPIRLENLAVDSELKCAVFDDLNKFRRNGKARKRGYLICGPPGSGKSSLIAAVANELEYDVYDFDTAHMFERNLEYLDAWISYIPNKSMLVIEDVH